MEISPNYSYIGYCKKEADWLADSQTISKCSLDEGFTVQRPPSGYSKKYGNVLQLVFKGYQLDLGFESVTKLDKWFKALQVTSGKYHNKWRCGLDVCGTWYSHMLHRLLHLHVHVRAWWMH